MSSYKPARIHVGQDPSVISDYGALEYRKRQIKGGLMLAAGVLALTGGLVEVDRDSVDVFNAWDKISSVVSGNPKSSPDVLPVADPNS